MEWRKDEVVGTAYGFSIKGWVDSELFRGWLSEHFLAHAIGTWTLLLLLDGHSSHYQPELITYVRMPENLASSYFVTSPNHS